MKHLSVPFTLLTALILAILIGCDDKPVEPDKPVKIVDGIEYFPMNNGDTWFYSSLIIKVDGDTVINGYTCKRVLLGNETDQAWSVTTQRYAQHMFEGCWWFDPPLEIPFDMEKGKPHNFSSLAQLSETCESTADSLRIFGSLQFDGYVTSEVSGVNIDSCLKISYDYVTRIYFGDGHVEDDSSAYFEIWGKGMGLITNGDMHLDMAIIDGDTLPAVQ